MANTISTCPNCRAHLVPKATSCIHCKIQLGPLFQELRKLQAEAEKIQKEMHGQWLALQNKLTYWEKRYVADQRSAQKAPEPKPKAPIQTEASRIQPQPEIQSMTEPILNPLADQEKKVPASLPEVKSPEPSIPAPKVEKAAPPVSVAPPKVRQTGPSATDKLFNELWTALAYLVNPLLFPFKYLVQFYQQYRSEGKLPVFFMTLGGIAALLFGFGYLMQLGIGYLIEHMSTRMFEAAKLTLGFGTSLGLMWWGRRLFLKEIRYQEFGSALMGLGIALNFLMLYFLTDHASFPTFGLPLMGWGLILANSVLGVMLALRYKTRIVVLVSLVGGAFAPFYLQSDLISPFYMGYLWLLSLTAIYIARRIHWPQLALGSFVVVSLLLEWLLYRHLSVLSVPVFAIALHAFAWLFFYQALFSGKQIRKTVSPSLVFVLAGAASLLLINLYVLYRANTSLPLLGGIYLGNALAFGLILVTFWNQIENKMRSLFFLLIAVFVGVSIPVLLDQQFTGLFWLIEGLALLAGGLLFSLKRVRWEAYILLAIALVRLSLGLPELFIQWDQALWASGMFNYLAIGLLFACTAFFYHRFGQIPAGLEARFSTGLKPVLSLWLTGFFYLISAWYLEEWAFNLAWIPLFAWIWWGNRREESFQEWLGLVQLLVLAAGYVWSISETGTFRFSLQTWPGKIAAIQLFVSLWGLQYFYDKLLDQNRLYPIITKLREIAYILMPALFLRALYRNFPEAMVYGYTLSAIISFGLMHLLKKEKMPWAGPALYLESYGWLGVSFVAMLFSLQGIEVSWDQTLWTPGYFNLILWTGILFALGYYHEKQQFDLGKRLVFEAQYLFLSAVAGLFLSWYLDVWAPMVWALLLFAGSLWQPERKRVSAEIGLWLAPWLLILTPILLEQAWYTWMAWGAVLIAFAWTEWQSKPLLRHNINLLLVAASLALIYPTDMLAALMGLAVLGGILWWTNGMNPHKRKMTKYPFLQAGAFYYLGLVIFLVSKNAFFEEESLLTVLPVIAYLFILASLRKKLPPIRNNFLLAYSLAMTLLPFSMIYWRLRVESNDFLWPEAIVLSLVMGLAIYLIYHRSVFFPKIRQKGKWKFWNWTIHLLLVAHYTIMDGWLSIEWFGIGLTVCLILHAICLLFLAAESHYAYMIRFSMLLFAGGFAKMIFFDFQHLPLIQKVVVCMIIGALMLLGSRLFLKYRANLST